MMLGACLVATNGVAQQVHSWTEHWSGSPLPHDCHASVDDPIGLIEVFRRFQFSKVGLEAKGRVGQFFIPNTERSAILQYDAPDVVFSRMRAHLRELSNAQETAALVLDIGTSPTRGRYVCSWLLGANGVIAAETVFPESAEYRNVRIAEVINDKLNVATRSAARAPRSLNPACPRDRDGYPEYCRIPREAGQSPTGSPPATADLSDASRLLFPATIASALSETKIERLLILPTGELSTVPFAALHVGQKLLIEDTALIILPDIGGLLSANWEEKDPLAGEKLIVGNPDLRHDKQNCYCPLAGAEREASYIAKLVDAPVLIGAGATQRAVLARLREGQARLSLIYLASHAQADAANPLGLSFVALTNDPLTAWKIREYKLTAQPLVVLSACNTGRGKTFEGGVFGLARAWYYAGAPRVVMSLWSINDAVTELLMKEFMNQIVRRQSAEGALRLAMLAIRNLGYADAALWAGFSVFGLPTK